MHKVALGLVVLAVVALVAQLYLFGPSDEELVKEALATSIEASREGRPGGVMEYLSRSFTYNGTAVGGRGDIANFIRESRPDVRFERVEPVIEGAKATVVSPVELSIRLGPYPLQQRIEQVEVTFSKESGTRWVILPYPKWRVSNVSASGIDLSSFGQ